MKYAVIISALVLAVAFSGHYALTEAQTASEPTPLLSTLAWDYSGLDADGAAEAPKEAEIVLTAQGGVLPGAPVLKSARIPIVTGANSFPLSGFWSGVAPGQYSLWLRGWDQAGNYGPWSAPLNVTLDTSGPAAPTGLKIVVTTIVQ